VTTRTEILRVVGILGWAAVIFIIATERRIVRTLRDASALGPETAVDLSTRTRIARWRLARLQRSGAVVGVAGERFYFDPDSYTAYGQRRRRRVLTVLAIVVPLAAAVLWWVV
jgi:hypothetical protein